LGADATGRGREAVAVEAVTIPRKATAFQLVFMTYAVICSGAYGLEEIISASGPGLSMVALLVLPVLYAAPISLTCAELSARYPLEGGYYRWVRLAFGDFVGYLSAWLVWASMFATNAAFAVLFGNYLRYFIPDLSPGAHLAVAAAVVWAAIALNYRGINLVGWASVVFTLVIFVPFLVMTVLGLFQWRYNPFEPFAHPDKTLGAALFDSFLIAMWLYGGFEKLTVNAAEVENPGRAFPLALGIAVPLCALSYIVPTLAALAANGDWQDWGESHFVTAAAAIGGPALGVAMALGGMVSNAGILMVTILGQSRLPLLLAEDGLFPPAFRKLHPRFFTPVVSLLVSGVVLTLLCRFRFAQLAGIYSLVQSLSYLLIYAALIRLRDRPATGDPKGFRIPVGRGGIALLAAPTVIIVLLVLRQGLWPGGAFDGGQALLDVALFASGPVTYVLWRWLRRPLSAALIPVLALLAVPGARAAEPDVIRVGMDTRRRPWAYVPGLDYSREDWDVSRGVQSLATSTLVALEIPTSSSRSSRPGDSTPWSRIRPTCARTWAGTGGKGSSGPFDRGRASGLGMSARETASLRDGKCYDERRTVFHRGVEREVSALRAHQATAEGEAQADPRPLVRRLPVRLREGAKEPAAVGLGEAGTMVADANERPALVAVHLELDDRRL
jgi:amino acid transporter